MLGSIRAALKALRYRRSLLRHQFCQHPIQDVPRPVSEGRSADVPAADLWVQNLWAARLSLRRIIRQWRASDKQIGSRGPQRNQINGEEKKLVKVGGACERPRRNDLNVCAGGATLDAALTAHVNARRGRPGLQCRDERAATGLARRAADATVNNGEDTGQSSPVRAVLWWVANKRQDAPLLWV